MNAGLRPAPRRRRCRLAALAAAAVLLALVTPTRGQAPQSSPDGIARLLQRLEAAVLAGNPQGYMQLVAPGSDLPAARLFAENNISSGASRVVVRERDRAALVGTPRESYRLTIDLFEEFGRRGQLATWRIDVTRQESVADGKQWGISRQRPFSAPMTVYRLAPGDRQLKARDLVLQAEDLELRLADGWMLTADTEAGPTVAILIGRGRMVFLPTPRVEREQMRIYGGADGIDTEFTAAFVRMAPGVVREHIARGNLEARPADPATLRLAQAIFAEDNQKSFSVKLADLAPGTWSLIPATGDFLAEVHTRRFGTLTYGQSAREPEDVNLFDRAQRRNISLYSSRQKLAEHGRFYDEDAFENYEVLHYDIDTTIDPFRQSVEGHARLLVRTLADGISSLTLRLAESIEVQSAVSREYGRLVALRVSSQNSLVINLPDSVKKGTVMNLAIDYRGRAGPQGVDREAITAGDDAPDGQNEQDAPALLEPSYLYSNRTYWYPQAETNGFATATLSVRVPPTYTCVASGAPVSAAVVKAAPKSANDPFVFSTHQPVRYLAVLITRLLPVAPWAVAARLGDEDVAKNRPGVYYRSIELNSLATPRVRARTQALSTHAADVLRFYATLMNDCPYPTLTLAVVERELPGGHSPGFLAVLAEPVVQSPYTWRADPTNFADFPEFFLAHELAHQWWGQAVGWKNYHEQWLSEGLAQYFAALYAERAHGKSVFDAVIGRMQEWGLKKSAEGPVYLGYRIGHVKRDSQLFRAIVYNKSAAVLHMLRRLLGDDVFFRGLRRFYSEWRFRKAGSDDLRLALEAESGQALERFFERWIYDSRVPRLKFSYATERDAASGGSVVLLRFDQVGDVFDVPVTVTLQYADRAPADVVVKVTEAATRLRVPLDGRLTGVEVNRDHAALARIEK